MTSDTELFQKYLDNQPAAFDQIQGWIAKAVTRHAPQAGDFPHHKDLQQKTHEELTKSLRKGAIPKNPFAYVWQIARNVVSKYIRKRKDLRTILDVQKNRHVAEIILFCANHITIDASSETEDMYKSLDETIDKIARRMRKYKTRLLKKHRPKPEQTIKHLDERIYARDFLDTHVIMEEEVGPEPEPATIHRESYRLRSLLKEEAIMELELTDRPFVLFKNGRRDVLQIVYKRSQDGEYTILELDSLGA